MADSRSSGFTLIEVVGALVIFSVGILMVMQVGGALTTQMRIAGARSEIVAVTQASVDSLEAAAPGTLTTGTVIDSMTVQGWLFERTITVTTVTPILTRVDVSMLRPGGGGPSRSVTSYKSSPR